LNYSNIPTDFDKFAKILLARFKTLIHLSTASSLTDWVMSNQYSFAPYQDPPEDIPAHERESAAFASASHYSSEQSAPQGEAFIGNVAGGDDRINQYETSLPLRYVVCGCVDVDWILKLLWHMRFLL
jgi:hypothetical protein